MSLRWTMANEWYKSSAIFCSVVVVVFLGPVMGERFYQFRDHRDQRLYEQQTATKAVHSRLEAKQQLEKYGYLHCRITSARYKRSFFPDFMSEGERLQSAIGPAGSDGMSEGSMQPCSSREVRQAIRQYQKTYSLPQTGILDSKTKEFMSTSRCGNSDKEDAVIGAAEGTDRASTSEVLNKFIEKSKSDSRISLSSSSSSSVSTTSSSSASSWESTFKKSRPWKRSVPDRTLVRVLAGKDVTSTSLKTRQNYYHNYINRLKRKDPFLLNSNSDSSDNKLLIIKNNRSKRSVAVTEHIVNRTVIPVEGQRFEKQVIKWRLLESGYSTRIPVEDQRATIDLAFRMWSEVIPLKFIEETSGDIASVDIEVAFGSGAHQNCKRDFDGNGGEIAHSFSTGNMHFDDDEYFKSMRSSTPDGIYLLRVAVHEIGHVLGLMHTDKKYSIMYAIYEKENSGPEFELGWEDRKAVQRVYGVCKGRFNTVFDWVRQSNNGQFIFNTYFFRGNHYWMYENHANRTRYGDPLYIEREWVGIPEEPDGYTHVWYYTGNTYVDDAYFYKGSKVYKYDNEKDELVEGWPKEISEVYPAKPGIQDGKAIPNNLDTIFFDMRDKNIYFFKDDQVYVYDPKEPKESQGCCVRSSKLQDEFPGATAEDSLPPNLDAVYYSYKDKAMYFIKDEDVWQNILYHPRQKLVKNSVKYLGKWFNKWFDICDVTTHSTYSHDPLGKVDGT